MSRVDQRTERLIVRRLDGELSEDERAELDRTLLRCPEARALLEEYQRIDGAAVAALSASAVSCGKPIETFPRVAQPATSRGYSRLWWVLPAAIAATIVLMVTFAGPRGTGPEMVSAPVVAPTDQGDPEPRPAAVPEGLGPVRQAGYGTDVDRSTDRDLLYILGTDGNIYVLEQERVRTARTPGRGVRQASGDL